MGARAGDGWPTFVVRHMGAWVYACVGGRMDGWMDGRVKARKGVTWMGPRLRAFGAPRTGTGAWVGPR